MSAQQPDWTTRNDHDPGVALVALFGFLGAALLWQSSGCGGRARLRLPCVLGMGLGVASAVWLVRQRYWRSPPTVPEAGFDRTAMI